MFLHIGKNNVVLIKDIVTIINLNKMLPKVKNHYLSSNNQNINVVHLCENKPKSMIFTSNNGNNILYFSSISADTLSKKIYGNNNIM